MDKTSEGVLDRIKVREVAGVFHTREALDAAVAELLTNGFDRADIDLMASADAVREKLGGIYVDARELPDVRAAPRDAFVAREDLILPLATTAGVLTFIGAAAPALAVVASGGALALAAAVAAAGGGLIGGAGLLTLSRFLERKRAQELEALMAAGGLVLWVRVRSSDREALAQEILHRHGADAVRVHEMELEKRIEDLPLHAIRPDPWLGDEPLAKP